VHRDISDLIFQGRGVLKVENDAGFPFGFARRMSAAVRTGAIKSALSANQRFHCAILRIVPTNPSPIEHVQFAAVNPPRRMSANTARLHFEMTRPSITVSESCRRVMLLSRSSFANDAQVGRPNLCRPRAAMDLMKVS
jgi:hypothetical protein